MSASVLLPASILALGSGPLVARLAGKRPSVMAFLDGFIMVSIGGLVLLEVVPHALHDAHYASLLFMIVGFVLPTVAERLLHLGVRQTHLVVLLLALVGLIVHSLLDGSALANAARSRTSLLGIGVVLHQLPVSLMIWWGFRDRPRWVSWLALSLMGAMTVAGFVAEPALFAAMPHSGAAWFEALVGGSLLHVVAHPAHDHDDEHDDHHDDHGHDGHHNHGHHDHADHEHDHAHTHDHAIAFSHARDAQARSNGLGALIGVFLLLALLFTRSGQSLESPFAPMQDALVALIVNSAPALLVAYFVAGLAHAFLPASSLSWMNRGSRLQQASAGTLVGLPLPICSCGVVPLYQQMVQQGVSSTAALAFLVATPMLGIDAVLLSIPLLGGEFTLLRVVATMGGAIVLAFIVGAVVPRVRRGLPLAVAAPEAQTVGARVVLAMRTGFGQMIDDTAPWIVLGVALAALLQPTLAGSWLTQMPFGVDVLVFAIIGFPLYMCASAATPLVAVFVAAGVSPGAGLALLLTGPAANVATVGVLARLHGNRMAAIFILVMTCVAVSLGIALNLVWPGLQQLQPAIFSSDPIRWWQWTAVAVLAALYVASLLRRGARGFLEELRLNVAD
ncbi:MAG: permease [Gemmatimonadaceae bacterium]|nr:permease [Gemmatimonadaceae bacterium]